MDADKGLTANGRELTRMKMGDSQREQGERIAAIPCPALVIRRTRCSCAVSPATIRVHSQLVRRSLGSALLFPFTLAKSDPFALNPLSASICVHPRLSSSFAVESWEVQA